MGPLALNTSLAMRPVARFSRNSTYCTSETCPAKSGISRYLPTARGITTSFIGLILANAFITGVKSIIAATSA